MVTKVREQKIAITLRQKGKSLNEITRVLKVSKSTASLWVRDIKLTTEQKQRLKKKEIEGATKGHQKMLKKWQAYRALHPKPIKGPRWPKRNVENFFDTWTPEMAYVLGYFAADGCMYRNNRGSYYIGFVSVDPDLIIMVKNMMGTNNEIEEYQSPNKEHQRRYTLQIGSKKIYQRLLELGFTPRKSLTLKFPKIPDEFLPHFTRGYFDGDGCMSFGTYKRKNRPSSNFHVSATFTSGSKKFLAKLQQKLITLASMGKGSLRAHGQGAYNLAYGFHNARQLRNFMYPTYTVPCLKRKLDKFKQVFDT